ncbi:DUF3986 family protein [Cytobacillus firmus]|uniref:DUF3986 family protein n=1 Tax=Cytobacillus firmus TaxID=1399 RepID=UPI001CFF03DA|nr:DUF3986 family protein [Cytobacillus firmus]
MIFDDRYHLHVGYYEDGHDIEGIIMKEKNGEKWCLFFDNDYYKKILNNKDYKFYEGFGLLVREYHINDDLTFEIGSQLLKDFLIEENVI